MEKESLTTYLLQRKSVTQLQLLLYLIYLRNFNASTKVTYSIIALINFKESRNYLKPLKIAIDKQNLPLSQNIGPMICFLLKNLTNLRRFH